MFFINQLHRWNLFYTVSYTGFGMLGTCVVTFVLMFLPKSRQMTAMGREGFFLEASTGGVATISWVNPARCPQCTMYSFQVKFLKSDSLKFTIYVNNFIKKMLEWFYSCKGKQGKINVFCVQICFKKNIKTWKIESKFARIFRKIWRQNAVRERLNEH